MSYHLPAEWHPQSAVLLTWPHENTDWAPWLAEIEKVYLELVTHISQKQLVVVACHDETIKQRVTKLTSKSSNSAGDSLQINQQNLRLFIAPCDDTWARDHGPITLIDENGETNILDFTFNAWGDKYGANLDDQITMQLIQQPFVNLFGYQNIDFILEGGSIESDGAGTVLTTEACLLNPNRNAELNKQDIEATLKHHLGMQQVIWLSSGHLAGDDTDAHIDTLARFAPKGIVYVGCDDVSDPHYESLAKMENELKAAKNAQGDSYQLHKLPWPSPVTNDEGEPLPATYANYLIINGAVLVPIYNDAQDDNALSIIAEAHPEHEIIGVNCRTVIEQYGSLHCLTMQLPKGLIS